MALLLLVVDVFEGGDGGVVTVLSVVWWRQERCREVLGVGWRCWVGVAVVAVGVVGF